MNEGISPLTQQVQIIEELRSEVHQLTQELKLYKRKLSDIIDSPVEYFLLARLFNIGKNLNNDKLRSATIGEVGVSIRNGDYYITNEKLKGLNIDKPDESGYVIKDDNNYLFITKIKEGYYRVIVAKAGEKELYSFRIDTTVDDQDKERVITLFVKNELIENFYNQFK